MRKIIPIIVSIVILGLVGTLDDAYALTFTTVQSGNWNDPDTWDLGMVPSSSDDKVIENTVTITTPITNTGTISVTGSFGDLRNTSTLTNSGSITTNLSSELALAIRNSGTMSNTGTISITKGSIQNSGTFSNSGTLTISALVFNEGFVSSGVFTNLNTGNIILSNFGNFSVDFGEMTNNGNIQILTSSTNVGHGLDLDINTIFTNTGTIMILNSGDVTTGIVYHGTFSNSGTITISNSDEGTGLVSGIFGDLTNTGTITVSNTGVFSEGILNSGTFENRGTLTISNTNGRGFANTGTLITEDSFAYPNAITVVENSGGVGIRQSSGSELRVLGDMVVKNTGGIGIENVAGNPFNTITIERGGSIDLSGTISNSNKLDIDKTNLVSSGNGINIIDNGTLDNHGVLTIIGTKFVTGIEINKGTLNNFGDMIISTPIPIHVFTPILNDDTINNHKTITISSSGTTGIKNFGTITNNDLILVQNTGFGQGIKNFDIGTIINKDVLSIQNNGDNTGIDNEGLIENQNTATISFFGTGFFGIDNGEKTSSVTNAGTILIIKTEGTGIINRIFLPNFSLDRADISNTGTITISSSGGTGIENGENGDFVNEGGTINLINTGGTGLSNTSGKGSISNLDSGLINIANTGDSVGIFNDKFNVLNPSSFFNFATMQKQCKGTIIGYDVTANPIMDLCGSTIPDPPVITQPTNGQTLNTNTPQIQGTTTNPNQDVKIYDGADLLGTTTSDSPWSFNVASSLTDGSRIFTAIAVNPNGDTSFSSTPVSITLGTCFPPPSGDWTVSSTCTMTGDATALGNVIVPSGIVLTVPNGITLDINFATKKLTVQAGGGVLIESGGTIT